MVRASSPKYAVLDAACGATGMERVGMGWREGEGEGIRVVLLWVLLEVWMWTCVMLGSVERMEDSSFWHVILCRCEALTCGLLIAVEEFLFSYFGYRVDMYHLDKLKKVRKSWYG